MDFREIDFKEVDDNIFIRYFSSKFLTYVFLFFCILGLFNFFVDLYILFCVVNSYWIITCFGDLLLFILSLCCFNFILLLNILNSTELDIVHYVSERLW